MNNIINIYSDNFEDKAMIAAKDWFFKLKSDPINAEILENFHAWLSENPEHQENYDLMSSIWDASNILKEDRETTQIINEDLVQEQIDIKKRWHPGNLLRPAFIKSFAIAATILLVITGMWIMYGKKGSLETYQTATGIHKTVYLVDGSTVNLDTNTIITSHITQDSRQIELVKGRALFSVIKDPNRSFEVTAGEIVVKAIGTEFNVYKETSGKISVAVTEGKVQINRKNKRTAPMVQKNKIEDLSESAKDRPSTKISKKTSTISHTALVSGQKIVVDEQNKKFYIKPVDVKKDTSWKTGRLYFQMALLPEVLEEVNRYLNNKIVIADSDLEDITISLNFDLKHRNNFLITLKKVLPIISRTTADGKILISIEKQVDIRS